MNVRLVATPGCFGQEDNLRTSGWDDPLLQELSTEWEYEKNVPSDLQNVSMQRC